MKQIKPTTMHQCASLIFSVNRDFDLKGPKWLKERKHTAKFAL